MPDVFSKQVATPYPEPETAPPENGLGPQSQPTKKSARSLIGGVVLGSGNKLGTYVIIGVFVLVAGIVLMKLSPSKRTVVKKPAAQQQQEAHSTQGVNELPNANAAPQQQGLNPGSENSAVTPAMVQQSAKVAAKQDANGQDDGQPTYSSQA